MQKQPQKSQEWPRRSFMGAGCTLSLAAVFPLPSAAFQGQGGGQGQGPNPELTIAKIKGDLYEIEGGGGNVAAYVTTDGVVIVDAKNYGVQFYDAMMVQLRTVTDKPVKYLINTHYHADHIGGNVHFADTTQIIQHVNARKCIVNRTETRRPPAPQPPQGVPGQIAFTHEQVVNLGGREVRARYFGTGHTNGDAFIFFPAERTLHTGDMMSHLGDTFGPLVDYDGGGKLNEVAKTLDEVLKMDFDVVIPGHGPVTDKAGLAAHRDSIVKFRNRAWSLIHGGKSDEEVAKVLAEENRWSPNNLNMWWTVPGMLKELKG
jgi:cyclase